MVQCLGSFALSLLSVRSGCLPAYQNLMGQNGAEAQLSNPHSSPKAGGRENRLKDLAPSSVHVLRSYSRNVSQQIPLVSHGQSCVAQLAVRAAALLATSPPLNTAILLLWKNGQYRASLVTQW